MTGSRVHGCSGAQVLGFRFLGSMVLRFGVLGFRVPLSANFEVRNCCEPVNPEPVNA